MAKKKTPKRKPAKRKRDYKAEYRRRLALGQRRGKTVQESRGKHPKEKPATTTRHGKVSRKLYTQKWEVGTMVRKEPATGFHFDKTRQMYVRKVGDLRTYHLSRQESADALGTATRLSRNAAKNYRTFFNVRFLVSNLPYGNEILRFGWTEPEFVETQEDLFEAIYARLKDDEPDEGRRTLIIALALA